MKRITYEDFDEMLSEEAFELVEEIKNFDERIFHAILYSKESGILDSLDLEIEKRYDNAGNVYYGVSKKSRLNVIL